MVTGGTLGSDDSSVLLCYWPPANINWYAFVCWICWASWRNGWIQASNGRVFGSTKFTGRSGKVRMTRSL